MNQQLQVRLVHIDNSQALSTLLVFTAAILEPFNVQANYFKSKLKGAALFATAMATATNSLPHTTLLIDFLAAQV